MEFKKNRTIITSVVSFISFQKSERIKSKLLQQNSFKIINLWVLFYLFFLSANVFAAAFECNPAFYQVIDKDLKVLSPSGNYTLIGTSQDTYNAMGWNVNDNYLYALGHRKSTWKYHLLKIGDDGVAQDLGVPLRVGDNYRLDWYRGNMYAADMVGNDLYVRHQYQNTNRLIKIDVTAKTYEEVNFSGALPDKVADITYINNAFWGVEAETLYKWDLGTTTITATQVTGLPSSSPSSPQHYGASWTDNQHNLYVSNNNGGIYRIDGYDTSNPVAVLVSDSEATNKNDGASCPNAAAPFKADLKLSKSVNPTTTQVGETVTFTLIVTNDGPYLTTGVEVTDNLPSGYTYVTNSISSNAGATGAIITTDDSDTSALKWSIDRLDDGESVNLTFDAVVNSKTHLENVAEITASNQPDSDSTPNNSVATEDDYATATVAIDTDGDGIADVDDLDDDNDGISDNMESGGNNPDADNDGDGIPAYLDNDDNDDTVGDTDNAIEPGYDNDGDGIPNHLDLDSDDDGIPDAVEAQPTNGYQGNDGDVSDDVDANGVPPYELTTSPQDTDGDGTPDYLDTDSDNDGLLDKDESGLSNDMTGTDNDGDGIDDGIKASYKDPDGIVCDDGEDKIELKNEDADSSDVDYRSVEADLGVEKSVYPANAGPGDTVVFEIKVTNHGPSNATGVKVSDQLPSGYTYVSDDGGGAYSSSTGVWTIGNLANGASATLQITATVNASGDRKNTATVSGEQGDPKSDNNSGNAEITYEAEADLGIEKSVSPANAGPGDTVVFEIKVTNHGPNDATGVKVSDQLPSGYTYVSDDGGGAYASSTGVWTIGNLANGARATLQITATVNASGDRKNTATVSGEQGDPKSDNNSADAEITDESEPITDVPTLSEWGRIFAMGLMLLAALYFRRRARA